MVNNKQCTATRSSRFRQQYFIWRKNNFVPYSSCLRIVYSGLNPPEAIRNFVTPLATPRSGGPGFCNPNGHTTVCQTVVFFLSQFASERQRPYHGFIDLVFLTPVAIPLSVRPRFFFFDNLDWDVNDHTPVSQTGSMVWSLKSQVKKGIDMAIDFW